MRSLAVLLTLVIPGCSCSVPLSTFDGGPDASSTDAPLLGDAPIAIDAPDARSPDAALPDAPPPGDAGVCEAPVGYPPSTAPSRDERGLVEAARTAFEAATGATVELDGSTAAVIGITGGTIPVTLDGTIADPCARALDALRAFFADHRDLFRMPADLAMRVCSYDALTDAEIVRLNGGTYGGRALLGIGNDLLAHVTRSGTLRYFAGTYLPDGNYGLPAACFDADGLAASVVGDALGYTTFRACVPGSPGAIAISDLDMRLPGAPALYLDASSNLHLVRAVEVYLDGSRVTPTEINSDLYCCPGASLDGCVGKTLIVDEVDGSILEQIPNCRTC